MAWGSAIFTELGRCFTYFNYNRRRNCWNHLRICIFIDLALVTPTQLIGDLFQYLEEHAHTHTEESWSCSMSNPSKLLDAIFEMRRSSSSLSLELFHLTHCSRSPSPLSLSLSVSLSSSVYCLFLFGRAAPCVVVKASFRLFLAWPFIALISAHFIKRSSSISLSLSLSLSVTLSFAWLSSARV